MTIGLFCFGSLSFDALLGYLKKKYGTEPSEIKQIRLSSKLIIETEKGEINIPLREASKHILPSCRKCTDYTNELADISIGGAYPLKDWSTMIIRTKAGEDFFFKAVENGVINTWVMEEEPTAIERVLISAMQKRATGLENAKKMQKTIGAFPALLLRETDALAGIKIADIMATVNIKTVTEKTTISEFLRIVAKNFHFGYPLVNENNDPIGWVTLEDAAKVDKSKRNETLVGEIARRKLVTAYPDETALDALKQMSECETGRILVVDRANPKMLVGIVTKTDLIRILTTQ
jgi:CBS domain-containing protein